MPPPPLHSLIVSSDDGNDTSSTVVDKIRIAVDARQTGIRVVKVRKTKDQKVVIGCRTRGELEVVKNRLGGSAAGLKIQEAVNRDPLVMLADVLSYNTDDDVARAILKQNQHLLGELKKEEVRVAVKYRKRARSPHECHVVVQVSPPVWQILTRAGRAHIDLQRVRVYDQTPLVQCTKCLGFGHGRKYCTGKDDLCSHCGDAHLRAECPSLPWWSEELATLKREIVTRKRRIRCAAPSRKGVIDRYLQKKEEYLAKTRDAQTRSWKEFCGKQDKEELWEGTYIYKVIGRTCNRHEDVSLKNDGRFLSLKESTRLLAETFYPENQESKDNADHRVTKQQARVVDGEHDNHDPTFGTGAASGGGKL